MVDRSELKALAKRAVENILQAYRSQKLIDYLTNALGLRICQSLIGNEWVTEEVQLLVASGGPNVWVKVSDDKIVGEASWGSQTEKYVYRTREASDILDIIVDILAHTA